MASHGHCVWDAALVLSQFFQLSNRFKSFDNLKVVELGVGVGLVGMTLAAIGARVVLTDQPYCLPLLQTNVDLNASLWRHAPHVECLQWGQAPKVNLKPVDLIVASDIIYNSDSFPLLLDTLQHLMSPTTMFYFCFETRNACQEQAFLNLLKQNGFILDRISDEECHQVAETLILECKPEELAIYAASTAI